MDLISDVHLHAQEPDTAAAWVRLLREGDFDALFILGDLFEVWVGDDVLDDRVPATPERDFVRQCVAALRDCTARRPVYLMPGNRDFLLDEDFHRRAGTTPLPDPCVLAWGAGRWLLTHGDAWCLDDHGYQRFRQEVRSPAWQADFLARPLAEREALARQMRATSQAHQAPTPSPHGPGTEIGRPVEGYADVDRATAEQALDGCGAQTLVHGHTHRPAQHPLSGGRTRLVLSDWDLSAVPPRAERLRLGPDGHWERRPWSR